MKENPAHANVKSILEFGHALQEPDNLSPNLPSHRIAPKRYIPTKKSRKKHPNQKQNFTEV